jgi:threonine dehydrogenase-like Zn-dependent dehydrogenase
MSSRSAAPALVFGAEGTLRWGSRDLPEPEADELVVAVEAVGLCGSDLAALGPSRSISGTEGVVIGHEVAGRVVAAGSVGGGLVGERVVVHPNISCGRCDACRTGRPNLCRDQYTLGIHRDGGAAVHQRVPVTHAYRIGAEVDPAVAALAEPLACVLNGIEKVSPRPGEHAVVLGAGPIGLLFCHVLAAHGSGSVIVSEPACARRDLARGLGATSAVEPGDLAEAVATATRESGADIVIDAVGGLLGDALDVAAPGARIAIFGAHPGLVSVDPLALLYKELAVFGVFTALHTFPRAVRLLERDAPSLGRVVTHRLPIDRYEEAFEAMRASASGKVVLLPAGGAAERGPAPPHP